MSGEGWVPSDAPRKGTVRFTNPNMPPMELRIDVKRYTGAADQVHKLIGDATCVRRSIVEILEAAASQTAKGLAHQTLYGIAPGSQRDPHLCSAGVGVDCGFYESGIIKVAR